ncbi:uncharacterized protein [Primulina huaijiensis]|uniref:uncharacterized protein n=1 Tax=Primulina huaijiensis TaxID=1492673 RepID=UPI003CC751BE
MHDIHGTDKGCYDRLRWYCRAVKETNPGSVAECEIDIETNKFKRLFICLHACVVGFFTGCRPLIFLDGTHIKNKFKVCILLAVSKDANDDLFTIAYSVVDAENDINWEWFCYHLRSVLLSYQSIPFNEYTFFSDRHPGIIKAVNLLFTGSHHAYCLRHLVDNFVKVVLRSYPKHNKKHWSSVFKKAAYAPSLQEHEQHIKNILESMPLARDFIVNSEPQSWANALYWQINKLPFKHACAAIESKSMSFYDFCDKYFKIEMYRQTYRGIINPIPTFDINESYLDDGNVTNAPDVRSQPGRRKTKRILSQIDGRT